MKAIPWMIVALAILEATAGYVLTKAAPIKHEDSGTCVYNGELISEGRHFLSGCLEVFCFRDGTLKVGRCPPLHVESFCEIDEFLSRNLSFSCNRSVKNCLFFYTWKCSEKISKFCIEDDGIKEEFMNKLLEVLETILYQKFIYLLYK